ncbi:MULTISPECIES: DUF4181 domain-containing protein [Pontibacillus]|uniref:DUF4181 domain-containing protein n=1 Tax=Pontibacillus chungwhensis TaxID=265426 RepID=A0ABY8UU41_9BACI|nr:MULTISPECIES: DUF4181 domain-containing protein [Pontibacillus]MCD5323456.1 DUF4181 domain-containing protein [Pontibacillus sp. HN14]WIF96833.1 DUF4181 domain-containing protein [Pontibacillus chungwhensis]
MTFVVLVILLLLILSLEYLLRKKFKIERQSITDTKGKHVDRFGRGMTVLIAISVLTYAIFEDPEEVKWYYMAIVGIQFGYEAFMQWMFIKGSKEYIITLVYLALGLFTIYNIDLLFAGFM